MTYENLLEEADSDNIYILENAPFESKSDGLINGDVIGINREIRSSRRRACVLAEELGHYHTTMGNIIDQSSDASRKQELRARMWAYNHLVGLSGIISAYRAGCYTLHETAEHLDVTEEFLTEAIECYRSKYGECARVENYIIYFEPNFGILELTSKL